MKIFMILGALIGIFGVVDLAGSFMDFDLWGDFLKIQLPEIVWKYSSYAEMAAGYGLFSLGSGSDDEEED